MILSTNGRNSKYCCFDIEKINNKAPGPDGIPIEFFFFLKPSLSKSDLSDNQDGIPIEFFFFF